MKPRSAKAKGKKLQNWVRDQILKNFTHLEPDDVRSTTMGDIGEDIKLSPAARKVIPYQIECKSRAAISVYEWYNQCKEHGNHAPLLIVKSNQEAPLVVIDAEDFFELLSGVNNNDSN